MEDRQRFDPVQDAQTADDCSAWDEKSENVWPTAAAEIRIRAIRHRAFGL